MLKQIKGNDVVTAILGGKEVWWKHDNWEDFEVELVDFTNWTVSELVNGVARNDKSAVFFYLKVEPKKLYKYAVFLRHPETKEVQHGTVDIEHDGFLDWETLLNKLLSDQIKTEFAKGYTLVGIQVVSVEDIVEPDSL